MTTQTIRTSIPIINLISLSFVIYKLFVFNENMTTMLHKLRRTNTRDSSSTIDKLDSIAKIS